MIKTSLSVVAALVTVAGLSAAPALAESINGSSTADSFNERQVLQTLRSRGVEATEAEAWGAQVKATIVAADGSTSFVYLDPDTLRPTGTTSGNTRVLTDIDVGVRGAAPASGVSLTWEEPTD
jgi:hypothetical protein